MSANCVLCGKVHGIAPSVRNLWHQCTTCGAVFCDDCGRNRLSGKRGLMDGTRQCVKCGRRTALVSMPQELHATFQDFEVGHEPQEEPWFSFYTRLFILFLEITTVVILFCGMLSYGLVGLFTGFKPGEIHLTVVLVVAGILFIPGEYIGIRIFLRTKRKDQQRLL